MRNAREIEIQESAIKILESYNISPFSVIFTYSLKQFKDGVLSITTYLPQEIDELLNILNYQSQSDKSGYLIIKDNNTLLLSGLALIKFYYGN